MKSLILILVSIVSIGNAYSQDSEERTDKWQIMFNVNESYSLEEVRDSKWSYPGISFQFNKISKNKFGFQTKIGYTKWNAYEISESAMIMFGANYKLAEMAKYQFNYFLNTGIVGYAGGDTYSGVHTMSETGFHLLPISKNGISGGVYFSFFPQFFNSLSVFAGYVF